MFLKDDKTPDKTVIDRSLNEAIAEARILIVDDNTANVELLREILIHHGYGNVVGETDSRRFEALARETEFDILLLDVRMPHLSGFDLIELSKVIYADTFVPILVLTAQTDLETRRKSLQLGANDFLNKPFVAWELLHRIRNALSTRMLYRRATEQNRELERRVAERTTELSDALVSAREGERAKLDFLTIMSHELRTPLNAIIGFAEVMGNTEGAPMTAAEGVEYAKMIEENGRGLLSMLNNVLEFTRSGTGGADLAESDFPLRRLIGKCVEELAERAKAREVTISLDITLPAVLRADRRRIKQALLAVLDNAIKFNHPGGRVRVGVERTTEGDQVAIVVADTGPGIPEAARERVFQPFQQGESTLNRRYDGIGLGLPLVRRYIESHGGAVSLGGEPGLGTVVTLALPATRVVGEETTAAPPATSRSPFG